MDDLRFPARTALKLFSRYHFQMVNIPAGGIKTLRAHPKNFYAFGEDLEPFGIWALPNLGQTIQSCLNLICFFLTRSQVTLRFGNHFCRG